MKRIAVLPTGDWCEVLEGAAVCFYELTDAEYEEFEQTGGEDTSLGRCIGTYIPEFGYQVA